MTAPASAPSPVGEPLAACPLCGSAGIPALDGFERAHLRRCHDCRFVFAGRRPSAEEIRRYYDGYGLADFDSPITRRRYDELLDTFEPYRRTNRILDVGCGEGRFLEVAARRGWEVHGTETTEAALERNRARGIAMTLAPPPPGALPPRAFDVVTAFEVLEHLSDLAREARMLAEVVREGGLLYVTTPNFDALSRRVLGPDWNVIGYPEHLGYFTTRTLTHWLEGAGFRALDVTTTGISPRRVLQSLGRRDGRRGVPSSGTVPPALDDENVRAAIERSPVLGLVKRTANAALGAARAGDTLKGRFERTGSA